jgi:hypothetical protein
MSVGFITPVYHGLRPEYRGQKVDIGGTLSCSKQMTSDA